MRTFANRSRPDSALAAPVRPSQDASGARPAPRGLQVTAAGDAHEREADRVAGQVARGGTGEPRIRATGAGVEGRMVDPALAERLDRGGGAGSPLPGPTRAFFEPRFGHDFGAVRVHADGEAARMSRQLGARAFTHGRGMYFGAGEWDPRSAAGTRLIAHELTHVVQQQGGPGLIQRAPPTPDPAAPPDPLVALKEELKSTYGLKDVVDGDATWTLEELQDVREAFKLLPAGDIGALSGVVLIRVVLLEGTMGGQFESSQEVQGTTVINEASIKLASRAFREHGPASYPLIVHEVGHAVATLTHRKAAHEASLAIASRNALLEQKDADLAAFNAVVAEVNALSAAYDVARAELAAATQAGDATRQAAAQAELDRIKQEHTAKNAEADRLEATWKAAEASYAAADAEKVKKKAAMEATMISPARLAAIKGDVAAKETAYTKAAQAADTAAKAFAEDKRTASEAYRTAVSDAAAAVKDFADRTADQALPEDDVDRAVASVNAQVTARDAARKALEGADKDNPALAAWVAVEAAQDAWFRAAKAHSLAHQRTARVQKFVEFVEQNRIAPITPYAEEHWPHEPDEFYAEAYSFYLAKPAELEAKSPALYEWFKAGKYL